MNDLELLQRQAKRHPVLQHHEEIALIKQYMRGGAIAQHAKQKLVLHNLRFVFKMARENQYTGVSLEDLVQAGLMGFNRAIEKFDLSKNLKLSTYAYFWVRTFIYREISSHKRAVRTPIWLHDASIKIQKNASTFYRKHGRNPTKQELAELVDMPADRVLQILDDSKPIHSLNQAIGSEKDHELLDLVKDSWSDPMSAAFRQCDREFVEFLLRTLTPEEKTIVELHYGLNDGCEMPCREIADKLKLESYRVAQKALRTALRKLKNTAQFYPYPGYGREAA